MQSDSTGGTPVVLSSTYSEIVMNIRTPLAALAFCLASTVAFAAPQASTAPDATKPATTATAPAANAAKTAAVKHNKKLECKKDETLVKGKCEPKKVG